MEMWLKRIRPNANAWSQNGFILIMTLILILTILLPLGELVMKAVSNQEGHFIGLANFAKYFSTPSLVTSLWNSIKVSLITTVTAVTLGFGFAYALERSGIRGKWFFRSIALLPLFAPSMLHGLALIYLFGNQGLISTGFFGVLPEFRIELYGQIGILLSEILYTFPQAFLILSVALASSDYRLYEAAETLGASTWRTFWTVTVPGTQFALISTIFVCFVLTFTDFGAPKVVGGQYNVLATDLFKQVIGQQNMQMGAAVGVLLLIPAVISFVIDRISQRKQSGWLSAKSIPYRIEKNKLRDGLLYTLCASVSAAILSIILVAIYGSVVKVWPYNLQFSFSHYDGFFDGTGPFVNSLVISAAAAVIGTMVTFMFAYLIEKSRGFALLRNAAYFISMLPLALPGLVLGLIYVFYFNNPNQPLNGLYGTIWIVIICNIVHFYSVSFLTMTSALKKLDSEFEAASETMDVPWYRALIRVTVPMSLPSILEIFMYYFINSMVTVSAIIFLYAPDLKPAAVAIVNMEDSGDTAQAAAMSLLIILANLMMRTVVMLLSGRIRRRTEALLVRKDS
ncbi:putative 2-aminoethylphosphonate ABC transporter permease subunit [Paenibacillus frigoriresistens]|uniref:putative 2-aminoethylphosphonate ABC transporter permease subunit n=1 Tax=Paenibacillus alginolyticus TaxID=59839 RepID=UPI0015632737|nr:putative 2-aminoethylphosphonate ABC transporter permease subunit [Paenibacillus frigoriresistens]NRF91683.1 putative 2-aminoethylphosphonate ABC transporter permease subunit [Paenibacillus frigoriresistens]